MELEGKWDSKIDVLLDHLRPVDEKIKNTIGNMADCQVKEAAAKIYSNLSAVAGTLCYLCKEQPHCSSQATGAWLRSVIEACVSVFAFCEDPVNRAPLYLNFAEVVRYKVLLGTEKSVGCLYLPPDDGARLDGIRVGKERVKAFLSQQGACYVRHASARKKPATEVLREALAKDDTSVFSNTWHGGSPSKVLGRARMQWVYDFLFTRLCSAVHSDVCAADFRAGRQRSTPAGTAILLWGVSIVQLAEALNITLPSAQKGFLRKHCCRPLQGT